MHSETDCTTHYYSNHIHPQWNPAVEPPLGSPWFTPDVLQKWRVKCRAERLVPMRFAIFPFHLSKVLRLPGKGEARSYEVLHPSRKIILANLKIWCSKVQPLSGNLRPDLLTSLMNMSLVLRLPCEMHLCRTSWNVPRLPSFLKLLQNPHVFSLLARCRIPFACQAKSRLNLQKWSGHVLTCWLGHVLRATTACAFSSSQLPIVLRAWCALYILAANVLRATTACTVSSS